MYDGGPVAGHGLLLDDAEELEGAAERRVRVGPPGALEVSHLQNVVVLRSQRGRREFYNWLITSKPGS